MNTSSTVLINSSSPSPSPSPSPGLGTQARIYVKQITTNDPMAHNGIRLLEPNEETPYFDFISNAISGSDFTGFKWNSSQQILSGDGDFLVFLSNERLTDDQFGSVNQFIYRKNLNAGREIELINKKTDGTAFEISPSWGPKLSISDNGDFVLFSTSEPLISNGFTGSNYFRKHISGSDFLLASDDQDNLNKNLGTIYASQMSSDGRYVLYSSGGLIYRKDFGTGLQASIVSKSHDESTNVSTAYQASGMISMSGDGSKFVYIPSDLSLISNNGGVGSAGLVLREIDNNTNTIILNSDKVINPIITQNGNKVFFQAWGDSIVENLPSGFGSQVFSWSQNEGIRLVTANASGEPFNSYNTLHSVSRDGRFVCISTYATNTSSSSFGTANGSKIIVKDTITGTAIVADADATGSLSNGNFQSDCSLSKDGKYITFSSTDKNN